MHKILWYLLELTIGFAILIAFLEAVLFIGDIVGERVAVFILLIPIAMISFRVGESVIEFMKTKLKKER